MNDDERRNLEKQRNDVAVELKIARAGVARLSEDIFEYPMEALDKIDAAVRHQGHADVVKRLDKNPGALGKIKGTTLMNQVPNPLKPNEYAKSQAALKSFVGEVDRTLTLATKLNDIEDALHGGPPRGGRDGPSGRG